MQDADNALKYYKGYEGKSEMERNAFNKEFDRLQSLAKERKEDKNVHLRDFCELFFQFLSTNKCKDVINSWCYFRILILFVF